VWLRKLRMEKYAPAFAAEGYDELWLLSRITKSDMTHLGVNVSDMNQILLPALAQLRETLGEDGSWSSKESFAEILRDMEKRIETADRNAIASKENADLVLKQLKEAQDKHANALMLKEEEKKKIIHDLESSKRDVRDAKHAVELAKRDTEDVRARLEDALNRFEDENSKILLIRRKAADDVMEAERKASEQVLKLRQEHLDTNEKIRMDCAEQVKEMMKKNQERITSAHHKAQEQIVEAQRECSRLVAEAQKQAFQKTVDEESIWEQRLDEERAKAAHITIEVNAEAEKRIVIMQDKLREMARDTQSEISKHKADVLREKNRADQLNWTLQNERKQRENVEKKLEKYKLESSKRHETLLLRVATLEQKLFESRTETASEKERRVATESERSRLKIRAENAEKLNQELRDAAKANQEKYKKLWEKERVRVAQSVAIKEITSGLENDLRAAAASGAAIAQIQAEVERAAQRSEMAAKMVESRMQDIHRGDGDGSSSSGSSMGFMRPSRPVPVDKPLGRDLNQGNKEFDSSEQQLLKDTVIRRNTEMLADDFALSPSILNEAEKSPKL